MEFSIVAAPARLLRNPMITSPSRPSTCTDTLYPLPLQVSIAVWAMVVAMASEMSLWVMSWAFAAVPASPDTSTRPAVR